MLTLFSVANEEHPLITKSESWKVACSSPLGIEATRLGFLGSVGTSEIHFPLWLDSSKKALTMASGPEPWNLYMVVESHGAEDSPSKVVTPPSGE